MPITRAALVLLPSALLLTAAAVKPAPRILQKGKTFSQAQIRIAVGDSVIFVNDDNVSHNVFSSTDGLRFNLKRQAPAAAVSVPFPQRGTAEVRCAFHPNMKLKVQVE